MKHLKFALVIVLALVSITEVNAQKKNAKVRTEKKMQFSCPMKCEGDKTYSKPGKCPTCGMELKPAKANANAAVYQCPMKCEGDKTYKNAGKCPKCKMDLKAVTAANTASQFICPMKCEGEKMYAKNGKCPVCKMDLAKVKTHKVAEDHTGHNHN